MIESTNESEDSIEYKILIPAILGNRKQLSRDEANYTRFLTKLIRILNVWMYNWIKGKVWKTLKYKYDLRRKMTLNDADKTIELEAFCELAHL